MKKEIKLKNLQKNTTKRGQVLLEFTFCFIIVLLLTYGLVMAIRWAGLSLAERRFVHEESLTNSIDERWSFYGDGPLKQVDPDFSKPLNMDLVFNGWDLSTQ